MAGTTFSKRSKTFSVRTETLDIPRWRIGVEINGTFVSGDGFRLKDHIDGPNGLTATLVLPDRLEWRLDAITRTSEDGTGGTDVELSTVLTNTSDAPLTLGRAVVFRTTDELRLGGRNHEIRCLSLPGELTPRRVYSLADPECPRESRIKTQFTAFAPAGTGADKGDTEDADAGGTDGGFGAGARSAPALQVGFNTFKRCNTVVCHQASESGALSGVEAFCDFAGWELSPGQSTQTETFQMSIGLDPYSQLEQWAERAADANGARNWEDPAIGWLGWAWVDPFTVERYEDVVKRNAEAVSRRLSGFGFRYFWISIGNLAGGVPGRWTEWNYECFPSGPEHLRRTLEHHGLKWGLWCAPYWICRAADGQLAELKEALLTDESGDPIVARSEWQFGDAGEMDKADRPPIFALDPSHPKTREFLAKTFQTYRRWGVRYYMIDFLQAGAGNISRFVYHDHHDQSLVAGPEVYHKGLSVVRQAAGDDTYLLTSSGPSVHNAGFADAIRTGNDFGEGRALYKDSYFYPATFVVNSSGFWTGARHALQNQAAAYYTHRKLYINDSGNVLTVDKPLAASDARIHATIHAMSGGASMIGDDLDRIDDDRLRMIKATLPRPRDVARPLDLFAAAHPDYPKVFHRKVDRVDHRHDVVAVYNFSDEMLRRTVALSDLGLRDDARFTLFEFWNAEYRGRVTNSFTAEVPPRDVRVYRLTEAERPTVMGTDMHLLMGEMEILNQNWDEQDLTLSGTAFRPEGERGNIFIHVPDTLRVAEPAGLWIAKDAGDHSLIVVVRLEFNGSPEPFSVRFLPLDSTEDVTHTSDWDVRSPRHRTST